MNWKEIFHKYTLGHSNRLHNITRPLKDLFGIPLFGYHRIDTEGRYTALIDRPDWAEHYLEQRLFLDDPFLRHPDYYKEGVCLYSSIAQSMRLAWSNKVQTDEAIILIEKDSSSVEFFIFAGPRQNQDFSKLYLNHLPLLKTFSKHFKSEVSPILKAQESEGYILDITEKKNHKCIDSQLDENKKRLFISSMGFEKHWKQFDSLTPREKECLKQLHEGKSIKEIAALLSLSPRTVEYYLENTKNKIDCYSKQDLIAKAQSFYNLNLF